MEGPGSAPLFSLEGINSPERQEVEELPGRAVYRCEGFWDAGEKMTRDLESPSLNSHAILPAGFHGHHQKYEDPRLSDIIFPILASEKVCLIFWR